MQKHKLVTVALWLTACLDEGALGKFDQANITAFAVAGETRSSVIDRADTSVHVTLPANAELDSVEVTQLSISALARTAIQVGDALDLREPYPLTVTAEDGTPIHWIIDARTEAPVMPPDTGDGGPGDDGGTEPGDCDSYVITYQLSGILETTDTPGGAGDAVSAIGPGEMTLRFVPTGPAAADVTLLAYQMTQNFVIESPGTKVTTETTASAQRGECGVARGRFSDGAVTWETCDYGPAPPLGTTAWSPNDVVGGPGCVTDYHSAGVVTCDGSLCGLAGLGMPKMIDDTYPQPFNTLEFNEASTSFQMRGRGNPEINSARGRVEVPTPEPSRTWLSFDGTEIKRTCGPVPMCP